MNQKLEHGMKVRARRDIYNVCNGKKLWSNGEELIIKVDSFGVNARWRIGGGNSVIDYTDLFEIIPNPMTAEEAMEKILEWRKKLTLIDAGLYDIIDEYKKGLGND